MEKHGLARRGACVEPRGGVGIAGEAYLRSPQKLFDSGR